MILMTYWSMKLPSLGKVMNHAPVFFDFDQGPGDLNSGSDVTLPLLTATSSTALSVADFHVVIKAKMHHN